MKAAESSYNISVLLPFVFRLFLLSQYIFFFLVVFGVLYFLSFTTVIFYRLRNSDNKSLNYVEHFHCYYIMVQKLNFEKP